MKKENIYICILLLILLITFFGAGNDYIVISRLGPNKYLMGSNKDDAYERLLKIEVVEKKKDFDAFLIHVLDPDKTNDLQSQFTVIRYIRENSKKEFLPNLVSLQNYFNSVNPDSTWMTNEQGSPQRTNKLRNAAIITDLERTIKECEDL